MSPEKLLRLSPIEIQPLLGEPGYVMVDVREPYEFDVDHLPGSLHIPLQSLPERLGEIPADRTPIFICSAGMRSLSACAFALSAGVRQAINLEGGLHAWQAQVDPSLEVA